PMPPFDGQQFGRDVVEAVKVHVKAQVSAELAPFLTRLAELEARAPEKGAPGTDGKNGAPGEKGAPSERGADGKDGRDGADGARGEKGEPGAAGVDGKDGAPGR